MGTNTFKEALKTTPILKYLKKQLRTSPRVKVALEKFGYTERPILENLPLLNFPELQDYYGLKLWGKILGKPSNLELQQVSCRHSYGGVDLKRCSLKIKFSVDENKNVVENRKVYVIEKDLKRADLRSWMTIIYDKYGIEKQLILRKYEKGEAYGDKRFNPDVIYRITRDPNYPFVACLERETKIPSGDGKNKTTVKSRQYILLDEKDFTLLVPDEHPQGNHSKLLTEKDLRALGEKTYTKFDNEEEIEEYYRKHLKSISKGFFGRKSYLYRPYQIGEALTTQESRPGFSFHKSLESGNAGLRKMAQKAGIPEYREQISLNELREKEFTE